MVSALLSLLLEATLVVPVGVVVVVVFVVDVIPEDVVGLGDVGLSSALIVAVLIILWIIVGIYMAHHLHLPTRFLPMRILQLHMDHLLAQAHP
jgi:hypothetical protein